MNKSVKVVFVIFFIFAGFCVSAQSALSQRYLSSANEKLAQGDYQRAFEYINYVMDTYEPDSIPQEVQVSAENIYYSYLDSVKDEGNSYTFVRIVEKVQKYPVVNSDRVLALIKAISQGETLTPAVSASREKAEPEVVEKGLSKEDLSEIIKMLEKSNAQRDEKILEQFSQQGKMNQEFLQEAISKSSESQLANSVVLKTGLNSRIDLWNEAVKNQTRIFVGLGVGNNE